MYEYKNITKTQFFYVKSTKENYKGLKKTQSYFNYYFENIINNASYILKIVTFYISVLSGFMLLFILSMTALEWAAFIADFSIWYALLFSEYYKTFLSLYIKCYSLNPWTQKWDRQNKWKPTIILNLKKSWQKSCLAVK